MTDGFALRQHDLDEHLIVYCLVHNSTRKDFLDRWMANRKQHESYLNFVATLKKVQKYGTRFSTASSKLSCVDSKLHLYEIKNFAAAKRVMAVIRNETVLLFEYEAHKGGNSNNDPEMMKRARKSAVVANCLIEEEFGDKDDCNERDLLQRCPGY